MLPSIVIASTVIAFSHISPHTLPKSIPGTPNNLKKTHVKKYIQEFKLSLIDFFQEQLIFTRNFRKALEKANNEYEKETIKKLFSLETELEKIIDELRRDELLFKKKK